MPPASVASKKLVRDFKLKGMSAPHFFSSLADVEKYAGRHPYSQFMRRAWETMQLNGILCVDGKPTVYFKEVASLTSNDRRSLYNKFWNQGLATLLVVSTPDSVEVFSSLARPAKGDTPLEDEHRLVQTLDQAARVLFVRRVQTGQIYRNYPESFQPDSAVDKLLLKNLRIARDQLHKHNNLPYKTVHSLLGRVIFTCYLIERQIIDERDFAEAGAKGVTNLHQLLRKYDGSQARDMLFDLFDVLQRHFNGSLFDKTLKTEHRLIQAEHMAVLRRFLNVEDLDTGQQTFDFWAYDFRMIPVETISSIYEEFLSAEDSERQRKSGAYYTPKYLAEMVTDVAVQGTSLIGKKILDPACGSGIFLVILFNRIAEQWRRRHPRVHNRTRAEELLNIIRTQLCGVDTQETACRIACFSLYLAFLDHLEPREIREIEKLRGKVLDNFLVLKDQLPEDAESPVIFERNFFDADLPIGGPFDIVIGNPPWVSRGRLSDRKALEWCLSEHNPYREDVPKKLRARYFQPAGQIAHPFMWKAPVHLRPNGRACFVLPTKVLFNNQTDVFQAGWFSTVTVDKIIQLSDWRHILFENAICPALIIRFARPQPAKDYRIEYEVPKVTDYDPRRGVITILPEDRKKVRLPEVLEGAKKEEISTVWKKRFWGTRRDVLLIDRLLEMPRLDDITGTPEKPKRFISGQGFQPYLPEYYEIANGKPRPKTNSRGKPIHGDPKPIWWPKDHLYIDAKDRALDLILTENDCTPFSLFDFDKPFTELRRSPAESLFQPPMVLVNHSVSRKAFCDFPVIFRHALQSFSPTDDTPENTCLLIFLAAVLNSDLADYYFFHTSGKLGIERDEVYLGEIRLLPFPLPDDSPNPKHAWEIIESVAQLMAGCKRSIESDFIGRKEKTKAVMQKISPLVYEYYDISEREQILLKDTSTIFKPSMMPPSLNARIPTTRPPTLPQRREYVALLCDILNSWAKRSPFKVTGAVEYSESMGTAIVKLSKSRQPKTVTQEPTSDELQASLANIQKGLPRDSGKIIYQRSLTVFAGDSLYILKPLAGRHWTKTAAINDADDIAAAILTSRSDE